MLTAEDVARVGYGALTAGRTVAVPGRTNKVLWRLPRLLPWSRVAKLADDYWKGGR